MYHRRILGAILLVVVAIDIVFCVQHNPETRRLAKVEHAPTHHILPPSTQTQKLQQRKLVNHEPKLVHKGIKLVQKEPRIVHKEAKVVHSEPKVVLNEVKPGQHKEPSKIVNDNFAEIKSRKIPENVKAVIHKPADILVQQDPTHVVINHPDIIIYPAPVIFHKPAAVVSGKRSRSKVVATIDAVPKPTEPHKIAAMPAEKKKVEIVEKKVQIVEKKKIEIPRAPRIPTVKKLEEVIHPIINPRKFGPKLPKSHLATFVHLKATAPMKENPIEKKLTLKPEQEQFEEIDNVEELDEVAEWEENEDVDDFEEGFIEEDRQVDEEAVGLRYPPQKYVDVEVYDDSYYKPRSMRQEQQHQSQQRPTQHRYAQTEQRREKMYVTAEVEGQRDNGDEAQQEEGDVVEFVENAKNEYVIDEKRLSTDKLKMELVYENEDQEYGPPPTRERKIIYRD